MAAIMNLKDFSDSGLTYASTSQYVWFFTGSTITSTYDMLLYKCPKYLIDDFSFTGSCVEHKGYINLLTKKKLLNRNVVNGIIFRNKKTFVKQFTGHSFKVGGSKK